jgi:hypothetical protein
MLAFYICLLTSCFLLCGLICQGSLLYVPFLLSMVNFNFGVRLLKLLRSFMSYIIIVYYENVVYVSKVAHDFVI